MLAKTLAAAVLATVAVVVPASTPARAAAIPPGLATGVDVSQWQGGIDFGQIVAHGHTFAIVKEGGSQLSEGNYITSRYVEQVDAARASGLKVGHYWLAGDYSSPTAAADYLVDHLRDYRSGDVIALDNEVLDESTRLWNDDQVVEFFGRVHERIGDHVPWLYMGANDLRSRIWPRTIALGVRLWVASWGANDGTYPGEPSLGGAYPSWSAHQYTSYGLIDGFRIDLNVARPEAFDIVTPGDPGEPGELPKTTTEQDGVPGPVFWARMQNWLAADWGYPGPIDGIPGPNTYSALQRAMRDYGYTGPIDGIPGVRTYSALQRFAAPWGYTGPIDGVPGPNTWRAVARFANQDLYD